MKKVILIAAFAYSTSLCQAAPVVTGVHDGSNCSLLFPASSCSFYTSDRNDDPSNGRAVEFVGFSAELHQKNVSIQWSAFEPGAANMYELERSEDGHAWQTIAYFGAIGPSSRLNQYSFTDKEVASPFVHYRVKEVNIHGQATYTPVRSVRVLAPESPVKISAAPGGVLLRFGSVLNGPVQVRLIRPDGTVAAERPLVSPSGVLLLPTALKGNYFVSVSSASGLQTGQSILL